MLLADFLLLKWGRNDFYHLFTNNILADSNRHFSSAEQTGNIISIDFHDIWFSLANKAGPEPAVVAEQS